MQYLRLKFPFWGEDKIQIESEIFRSLLELGYNKFADVSVRKL